MLNCDCMRETQSPHCKGEHPTQNALSKQHSLHPLLTGPTQNVPQGTLRSCQTHGRFLDFVFSMAVGLFAPPLGRGEVGPFCFLWAHFNTLVA